MALRVLRKDRVNRQGGGVPILAKKSLSIIQISNPVGSTEDLESLAADMKTRGDFFRLICVYRPPNASNQLSLDLWRSLSFRLCPDKSPVFIVGDFNLPNVDWNFICRNKLQCSVHNHVLKEFFSFVRGNGLSQLIKAPTCGKNVLDLFSIVQ